MNLIGLALYIVLWWMAFFTMLPLGVRNLDEAGVDSVRGAERGAPAAPQLARKALFAAGISAVIWLIGFALLTTGVIQFRV